MADLSDKDTEILRLRQVLDEIAHSWSNDPDFLRNKAAEAIFTEDQSLPNALGRLETLGSDEKAHVNPAVIQTAAAILMSLDPKYAIPHCYPHGTGGLTMTWHQNDKTIMLIVGDGEIDFRTMDGQKTAVRVHNINFTNGSLSPEVLRHIPIS